MKKYKYIDNQLKTGHTLTITHRHEGYLAKIEYDDGTTRCGLIRQNLDQSIADLDWDLQHLFNQMPSN